MADLDVDVAIVGAGTAGAAAAYHCARRGLRAVCVDRRKLDDAGARWVNGVTASAFDEAGIPRPERPELFGHSPHFHLVAGWGPKRVVIRDHDLLEIDMRALVARLQRMAREAGATLLGETHVQRFDGAAMHTAAGKITARWFVDASGLAGARLLAQPATPRADICAAAQAVFEVADARAADEFFARHEVPRGETLAFGGIAGGYSVLNARLEGERVQVLTGSIPADGHASGQELLDRFVREQPWIGARVFGGARAIPLRSPHTRLAQGNVALLGDAACQVFSAHGSGIGPGLVAARILADALAEGRGVVGYGVDWQRRYGALFVAYDLFRRLTQRMTVQDVEAMIATGLLDEPMARAGLCQQWPDLSPAGVLPKLPALTRAPRLAARFASTVPRMLAVRALHPLYPRDPRALSVWTRALSSATGVADGA